MESAAIRSGRAVSDILLMGVTKTVAPRSIFEAYDAGVRLFGENRVQEFATKAGLFRNVHEVEWRLIGHLQSNKAQRAAELFAAVDSLDSLRVAEKLNSAASAVGKRMEVLIEVNIGGEATKAGLTPGSAEFEELVNAAPRLEHLEFRGLMTIPPFSPVAEESRKYFQMLCQLRDEIEARRLPAISFAVLSMGMSHDFEIAIEEGSTCIRVGTAIFGERNQTGES